MAVFEQFRTTWGWVFSSIFITNCLAVVNEACDHVMSETGSELIYRLDSLRSPGMYGLPAFTHSPQLSPAQKMGGGGIGMGMEERGLFDEDVPGMGMGIYS